jgi:hypothetical protein
LFSLAGFKAEVRSISILPLPDWVSRILEKMTRKRGHFLLIRARKPQNKDS